MGSWSIKRNKRFYSMNRKYPSHLALNYKQKILLGIVLIPDKDEFWISNNEMVWCENITWNLKKPNLSSRSNLNEIIIMTRKNHVNQVIKNLINIANFKKVIAMGHIGYKIASM